MEKVARGILKGKDVKLEGRFHLKLEQDVTNSTDNKSKNLAPAQVSIVENHPEFVVLEVICGCGAKNHIRCEYSDAQPVEKEPDQEH